MEFNAQINECWHPSTRDGATNEQIRIPVFTFTKYKIRFPKEFVGETLHLAFYGACAFQNNVKYTIEKALDGNDKRRFQITINNDCTSFITLGWLDRIKCNIIHKRYWVQKEYDWIYKYIITAILTVAIAIYAGNRGFNKGYQEGLKAGKSQSQLPTPK